MALKNYKSTWLFDCGEDSQRQVHKQPLIRHGKMDRVFITNRRANNILGLPGTSFPTQGSQSRSEQYQ